MTIYRMMTNLTATTTPVAATIITPPENPAYGPPVLNQLFQFEVNGPTTCTATFQPIGTLGDKQNVPPNGNTSAWVNIGSAVTITCTTPGIAPAVNTASGSVPFRHFGVILVTLSGVGAVANAYMNA